MSFEPIHFNHIQNGGGAKRFFLAKMAKHIFPVTSTSV